MFIRVQTSCFVIQHSAKVFEKFLLYFLHSLYVWLNTIINYPNISCYEHTQNFPKWDPNTPHRTNLANITGRYSCGQSLRNYISDVTFNYFYSDSRKVPRIKADILTPVNSTPYDSWCTTFDFLVVFNGRRFIVSARGTKISYDRWSDIAHVVSELPTARKPWYISFLPTSFKSLNSLRSVRARDTAYFESYTADVFPVFRPVLSKGASKAKIVWHLSMLL